MSAYRVVDYPRFESVVQGVKELVFLCGAGSSMSLCDEALSWPSWISAGKAYLDDDQQEELDRRLGSWTSDELIDAATYLFECLKVSDDYTSFMNKTIGALHCAKGHMSKAFQDISRAGDIIATTNYDLLLEEATGLGSVSYSTPGAILSMVKGESPAKVVHLHGLYDRLHGIDDIVADKTQYADVLGNSGAQFVQQFLGTHCLIVVGCGATLDDPNLSGFMSFLTQELKLTDVPYFYLMKEGDAVPELPDNAIPIYYGNDYGDLPSFMEDIASHRLRSLLRTSGYVSVNPYVETDTSSTAFGRLHYLSGFCGFVGRKKELRRLEGILANSKKYVWWAIWGRGGVGKSRLVLEWLRSLPSEWCGFFTKRGGKAFDGFQPFTNTVVILDYVFGEESECAQAIESLMSAFELSPYLLRVLFVERDAGQGEGGWLSRLRESMSGGVRLWFESSCHDDDFLEVDDLTSEDRHDYVLNYLRSYVPLLGDDAFAASCLADANETTSRILRECERSLGKEAGRPLYLSILTEVWIDKQGEVTIDGHESLLREYLVREKKRWRVAFNDGEALLSAYLKVLAVACVNETFNLTDHSGCGDYLRKECARLIEFLDERDGALNGGDTAEALFFDVDERLEQGEEDVPLFLRAMDLAKDTLEMVDDDSNVSNDEVAFAYTAPYIKLDVDVEEFYYQLLKTVGAMSEDDAARLEEHRQRRHLKESEMPDYAWILNPKLPDIIKSYIVTYVVKDRDAKRFARFVRSNSVNGIKRFLAKALEDWPNKHVLHTMLVTPPDEVLNCAEYYFGLIDNAAAVEDFAPIERYLVDSDSTLFFEPVELALWVNMAAELEKRGDRDRLYSSACALLSYIADSVEHCDYRHSYAAPFWRYVEAFYNLGLSAELRGFLNSSYDLVALLGKDTDFAVAFCDALALQQTLQMRVDSTSVGKEQLDRALELVSVYEYDESVCSAAMELASTYLSRIIAVRGKNALADIVNLREMLAVVQAKCSTLEVAETMSLAIANQRDMSYGEDKNGLKKDFRRVESYLRKYPDSVRIASAYATLACITYERYDGALDVPDQIMEKVRGYAGLYLDEVELQERLFGLLLCRLKHVQRCGEHEEVRAIGREMRAVVERANYEEYGEKNWMLGALQGLGL